MLALERLLDGSITARNFQKLQQLVIDTGGQSVGMRFGTTSVTWPGGAQATNVPAVDHGLGRTPVVALLTPLNSTNLVLSVMSVTATQITVQGATRDESSPVLGTTRTVHWLVIG